MIIGMDRKIWEEAPPKTNTQYAEDLLVAMMCAVDALQKIKDVSPSCLESVSFQIGNQPVCFSGVVSWIEFYLSRLRVGMQNKDAAASELN